MKKSTLPASNTLAPTKMYSVTCKVDEYTTKNFGLFSSKKKAETFTKNYKVYEPMSIEKKVVSPEHWTPIIKGDDPEVLRSKIETSSNEDDVEQLISQAESGTHSVVAQMLGMISSSVDYYAEDMIPFHKLFWEYSSIVFRSHKHRTEQFSCLCLCTDVLGWAYRKSLL